MDLLEENVIEMEKEGMIKQPEKEKRSIGQYLKQAYKQELLPTLGAYVPAAAAAYFARTSFARAAPGFMESDALISVASTAIDVATFWGVFIPALSIKDREDFKNLEGKLDWKNTKKKAKEYGKLIGVTELFYLSLSAGIQYGLSKLGVSHETASQAIILSAVAIFVGGFPVYEFHQSEKTEKEKLELKKL